MKIDKMTFWVTISVMVFFPMFSNGKMMSIFAELLGTVGKKYTVYSTP